MLRNVLLRRSVWALFAVALSAAPRAHATPVATPSERGPCPRLVRAVKADAQSRGLRAADKVVLTGDSFVILSISAPAATRKPIERVMASGTVDRSTGKVTSFNPILMD